MERRPTTVAYFQWSPEAPRHGQDGRAEETEGPCPWKLGKLDRIGRGTTRDVYDLGDGTVLKVCRKTRHAHRVGYCPCETEGEHWNRHHGKDSESLFAPVVAYGPCWIRMKKADDVPVPCVNECPHGMPYDARWYKDFQDRIAPIYAQDLHPGQVGKFGDSYRLLDYGI